MRLQTSGGKASKMRFPPSHPLPSCRGCLLLGSSVFICDPFLTISYKSEAVLAFWLMKFSCQKKLRWRNTLPSSDHLFYSWHPPPFNSPSFPPWHIFSSSHLTIFLWYLRGKSAITRSSSLWILNWIFIAYLAMAVTHLRREIQDLILNLFECMHSHL